MQNEVYASILLNSVPGINSSRFNALVSVFGSAHDALQAGVKAWVSLLEWEEEIQERLIAGFDKAKWQADIDVRWIEEKKIYVYLLHAGPYPKLLREIYDPPPIIYVWGEDICGEKPTVAIVGSRQCSYYGEKMARQLASQLADVGVATVSGMARGIDTAAHRATISSHGKTLAVLGSGLNELYPPENKKLAEMISNSGSVISEFAIHAKPFPSNFPRRNRIIVGLSLGVVVVEGHEKSGSLITARMAAEEGRDVFAVPGPVTSLLSVAPHRLLRLGAKMVESATDIVEEFAKSDQDKLLTQSLTAHKPVLEYSVARTILDFMGEEPMTKEQLAAQLGWECAPLSSLLLDLELKGFLKSVSGGMVVKV